MSEKQKEYLLAFVAGGLISIASIVIRELLSKKKELPESKN